MHKNISRNILLIICLLLMFFSAVSPVSAATFSASTVAKGDTLYVSGEAPGASQVALYFFGPNYFHYATKEVDNHEYQYELKITDALTPSQYFCIVQSPGTGNRFSVGPVKVDGTTYITTQPSSGVPETLSSFIVEGSGSLQSSQAADALVKMINSPNIPDICQTFTFQVMNPQLSTNSVGTKTSGQGFTIYGTTNLAETNQLLIEITRKDFWPSGKDESSSHSYALGDSGTAFITKGPNGENSWSFSVKPLEMGTYILKVSALSSDVSTSEEFEVVVKSQPPITSIPPTTSQTQTQTQSPTQAESAGFGVLVMAGALLLVTLLRR